MKSFKKLCRQTFACEQDAKAALDNWQAEQAFILVEDVQVTQVISRAKPGRPGADDEKHSHFELKGVLVTDLMRREEAQLTKGLFILSTNDLSDTLSMQFLLDEYKSQQAV